MDRVGVVSSANTEILDSVKKGEQEGESGGEGFETDADATFLYGNRFRHIPNWTLFFAPYHAIRVCFARARWTRRRGIFEKYVIWEESISDGEAKEDALGTSLEGTTNFRSNNKLAGSNYSL